MCGRTASDHGSHAAPETGKTNHNDVGQKEKHKEDRHEEMYGARGLLSAQKSDRGRNDRRDGRRHGQARPDYQRKQNENNEQIRKPLQHVIRPGFRLTGGLEAQMPGDHNREPFGGEVGASGKQIPPEMSGEQSPGQVKQASPYSDPGGLEMEIAAPSVLVGEHVAIACRDGGPGGGNRELEQGRSEYIAGFPPIEARVRNENFNSADEQGKEG